MDEKRYDEMAPGDEAPPGEPTAGEDVCPACEGTGRTGDGPCGKCDGTGRVEEAIGGG